MLVAPPPSLRVDRTALLRDVADRLAARSPELAARLEDPTDPSWMLVDQCAWMVEQLSIELDHLPLSMLQSFVRLLGGQRNPALPALGVVVVEPRDAGVLQHPPDAPAPWRFFTGQTEERDVVEFALGEPSAPVRRAAWAGYGRLRGDELEIAGGAQGSDGVSAQVAVPGEVRAPAPLREVARYTIVSTNPDALRDTIQAAIGLLDERRVGWLSLTAHTEGEHHVVVEATVDLGRAFARTCPGGLGAGEDVLADWGTLDDTTWTPPVRRSASLVLPGDCAIFPGPSDGTLLVTRVPAGFPLASLLELRATPLPAQVVTAVWTTLSRMDERLSALRPTIQRALRSPDRALGWLEAALPHWDRLDRGDGTTFLHAALQPADRGALRLGLLLDPQQRAPRCEAWGLDRTLGQAPLPLAEAWTLDLPDVRGSTRLLALNVDVPSGVQGVLVVIDGDLRGAVCNPVLVVQAPAVADGREVRPERAVPEAVTLMGEDVVTNGVRERLLEQPLPARLAQILRRLPLASFAVADEDPIRDFSGVGIDASAGQVLLNAPDDRGQVRELRPNTPITLSWYRRTDGDLGEVPPGAIAFVEHPPSTRPALNAVTNPLGTGYAAARESDDACRDRLFAPADSLPVLPGDWERAIKLDLGTKGRTWLVRCWGYTERSLLSHALWPLPPPNDDEATAPADPEDRRLASELDEAGPNRLLVAVGPMTGELSAADLAWARQVVLARVRRVRARLPAIEDAIVTRLWPLTLIASGPVGDVQLPSYEPTALPEGLLRDEDHRKAPRPRVRALLNAVVVAVEGPR